ncbi:MAG: DMT family transporter [Gemmobacter sp.]|uniref:DMT family transporter n=1 Tax=Gemmobacter sp. TaxID=1898957 RepID=UPI003918907C
MSSAKIGQDNLRGGLLMVASMAAFSAEDTLIKGLAGGLPTGQIIATLGVTGTLALAIIATSRGAPLFGAFATHPMVLLRNFAEMTGAIGFVTALVLMPLSVASALFQTLPLAITLGAALFLGEKVGWRRWTAIAVGFAGVLVILRPGAEGFDLWAAAASMLAVMSLAVRDLATRRVGAGVPSLSLSVWGSLAFVPAGLALMALAGQSPVVPDARQWVILLGASALGVAGYWLMVVATRVGEVSAVMPYRYSRILFSLLLGWAVFAERPDWGVWLGSAMIVGSGLYTFFRERALRLRG